MAGTMVCTLSAVLLALVCTSCIVSVAEAEADGCQWQEWEPCDCEEKIRVRKREAYFVYDNFDYSVCSGPSSYREEGECEDGCGGLSTGAIVGIVLGAVGGLLLIILLIVCCLCGCGMCYGGGGSYGGDPWSMCCCWGDESPVVYEKEKPIPVPVPVPVPVPDNPYGHLPPHGYHGGYNPGGQSGGFVHSNNYSCPPQVVHAPQPTVVHAPQPTVVHAVQVPAPQVIVQQAPQPVVQQAVHRVVSPLAIGY